MRLCATSLVLVTLGLITIWVVGIMASDTSYIDPNTYDSDPNLLYWVHDPNVASYTINPIAQISLFDPSPEYYDISWVCVADSNREVFRISEVDTAWICEHPEAGPFIQARWLSTMLSAREVWGREPNKE